MQVSAPNFLIYDASAGSGKTFTLTKEYLKILLAAPTNDAYKKILAITFTNKAVNEMKSRIVSSLLEFSKKDINSNTEDLLNEVSEELNMSRDEIQVKSAAIIKSIIYNYASFDISTIDKFTHRLIRTFAIDLGLPVTFEITLDKSSLIKEAVDRLIAKAGTDNELLLTQLLLDFALTKVNEGGSWDFTRELLAIGNLIGDENHDKELEAIKNISLENFIEIRKQVLQNRDLIQEKMVNLAANLLKFIDEAPYGVDAFSRKTIPNHLTKIAAGDFKSALEYIDPSVLEKRILKKYVDDVQPDFDVIWEQLASIYTWAGRYLFFDNVAKNITPLSLLNLISNEINLIQQEQNVLSISQFNKLINEQIQEQPAPFIYEKLGDRYNHFFIDEFQDTSEMQWNNLVPLLSNAVSGNEIETNNGSVMLVGDAKQSIYRWRGGNPEQFINLSNPEVITDAFAAANKKVNILEYNYRSFDEVVTFNNDFFRFLGSKLDNPDYHHLYCVNSFQKTKGKPGGYVSIDFISNANEENEDGEKIETDALYLSKTIKIIQSCLDQGFNYQDIALLTRRREKGVLLANFLVENNIPIISSETLLLSNSDDVNFIISILQLLYNFSDAEAKFNALFYIKNNFDVSLATHDFIAGGLSLKTEADLEHYILSEANLSFSFDAFKKQGLYQACENIIALFLPDKSTVAYVQYFLDLVIEQEAKQYTLAEFVSYWFTKKESLSIPSPENVNAVKIMTVHKSKGLEFPVVIFPFVNNQIIRPSGDKLWVDLPSTENISLAKALINKKAEVVTYSDSVAEMFVLTNEKITLDTINVLYVALTRAREQLYIISEEKVTKSKNNDFDSNSVASYFLEYLANKKLLEENVKTFTFGICKKKTPKENLLLDNNVIKSVKESNLRSSAIKISQKEAQLWGKTTGKAIGYGNLVHEVLSMIISPLDVGFVVDNALRKGILAYEDYEQVKYIIKKIVTNVKLADHFNTNSQVLNERSIVNSNFTTIKPDRVTLDKQNATLLDYKTGAKKDEHIKQLLEYEQALLSMGYQVVKKTLVYIGNDVEDIVNL